LGNVENTDSYDRFRTILTTDFLHESFALTLALSPRRGNKRF